jgi:hypothetical protein
VPASWHWFRRGQSCNATAFLMPRSSGHPCRVQRYIDRRDRRSIGRIPRFHTGIPRQFALARRGGCPSVRGTRDAHFGRADPVSEVVAPPPGFPRFVAGSRNNIFQYKIPVYFRHIGGPSGTHLYYIHTFVSHVGLLRSIGSSQGKSQAVGSHYSVRPETSRYTWSTRSTESGSWSRLWWFCWWRHRFPGIVPPPTGRNSPRRWGENPVMAGVP